MKIADKKILPIIKAALKEDIGQGDVTSELIIPPKKSIKIRNLKRNSPNPMSQDRRVFQSAFKT